MRVYADGSALVRYLPEPDFSVDWQRWAEQHERDLVTTSLSLGELRSAALRVPVHVRARAHVAAARIDVVRYSDQALGVAAMDTSVLSPFAALHLGVAVAHPGVTGFATYDPRLAAVAALHGLDVVSPGLPPRWWD